jgi:hypothetical protein
MCRATTLPIEAPCLVLIRPRARRILARMDPQHRHRLTPFQRHALLRLGQVCALGAVAAAVWLASSSQWGAAVLVVATLPASLYVIGKYRNMTPRRWARIQSRRMGAGIGE